MAADRTPRSNAIALAHALLADAEVPGARSLTALHDRVAACLGLTAPLPPGLFQICTELAAWPEPMWRQHGLDSLADVLLQRPEWPAPPHAWQARHWLLRPARMQLAPMALAGVALPELPTHAALAAWLGTTPDDLQWLAHPSQRWRESQPTDRPHRSVAPHYRYQLLTKPGGGLRLLEMPLPRLKTLQRRLLHGLLARVPVHEAARGFVAGRGVRGHANLHAGQPCVLCFDLRDFFGSVGGGRIHALWRSLGYPEGVARTLIQLCTTRTPPAVRERMADAGSLDRPAARRLASAHLPQGAPTSPALANLSAFGLDLRLDGLAWRFGARYSRYADDLVFSGPAALRRDFRVLHAWVEAIALDEGFALNPAKTRCLPAHRQQRVTGVVVNERPNLPRADYDRLRAELHALGHQTRVPAALKPRLQGRIAWARQWLAPERAAKLQRLLERIAFDGA
ncbi:reverse transcriptase family protein [Ottowia testudinis]|uniref:RNA-directed DNA polymerase n=1 Tax=Ottowia testudinis TaxID=2816950 RepID=A0A975CDZ9_9BURK|nr:reverse transcriptase family protein [Ottowia testudinis]QTD44660.1 RNA-directed DNA polymerase [Ottowia testudinis]